MPARLRSTWHREVAEFLPFGPMWGVGCAKVVPTMYRMRRCQQLLYGSGCSRLRIRHFSACGNQILPGTVLRAYTKTLAARDRIAFQWKVIGRPFYFMR